MDLSLFNYTYPEELIAQHPLPDRSASRLMVMDPINKTWEHRTFKDFADYFGPEDLLIFNDVRVMSSRLYGVTKRGRKVEILLLDQKASNEWQCLIRPADKLRSGTTVHFSDELSGMLRGRADQWMIQLNNGSKCREIALQEIIEKTGLPPLPPYIKRDDPFLDKDKDSRNYQTVYAKNLGAAAAPTAGFHFTDEILTKLKGRGSKIAYCTLHVGRDTFQPVRVKKIQEHQMHGESYSIPKETVCKVIHAKEKGHRITAIGTTTVRALESAFPSHLTPHPLPLTLHAHTEKFIYPGYRFNVVDRLLTNFHQPKSTLVMLVAAFAGREFLLQAYQEAIQKKYRLFSFGDAMMILNCANS